MLHARAMPGTARSHLEPSSLLGNHLLHLVQQQRALPAELLVAVAIPCLGHGPLVAIPLGHLLLTFFASALQFLPPLLFLLAKFGRFAELLLVVARPSGPPPVSITVVLANRVLLCLCLVCEHEMSCGVHHLGLFLGLLFLACVSPSWSLILNRLARLWWWRILLFTSLDLCIGLLDLCLVNQLLLDLGDCVAEWRFSEVSGGATP
ncbi:hypothetical protein HG530_009922 [Fusarium avenaceum]|nr:hypothetical protein HG530_009922 [Fusarium avenaceum]